MQAKKRTKERNMLKVKSLNGLSFLYGVSKKLLVPIARELATDCTIRVYCIQIWVYLFLIRSHIIFVYSVPTSALITLTVIGLLSASNPTTYRLERSWQYSYTVVFWSTGCSLKKVYEKPKHVGAYNVFMWFLTF